jgi:hypothetical protein
MKYVSYLRVLLFAILSVFALSSSAHAAITWDFTGATAEIAGLGLALVAAMGLAISGGLPVFGLKKAWNVIAKMISSVFAK